MQSASSGAIYKVAFNRLGDQIATGASDGTVRIWDARTGRERIALEWHPGAAVNDLRFDPTSKQNHIVAAGDDGMVNRGRCTEMSSNTTRPPTSLDGNVGPTGSVGGPTLARN